MKRHLNTSYRLVWNHMTGAFVVASELARARGKRGGVAVALSLAAVTSLPVLAADIVVHPGETVNGGTLANHDNQIVFGTTNGMTISTGLEYGPDNEANTGGQLGTGWRNSQQNDCHQWWSSESEPRWKCLRHGYQCRRRTEPSGTGSEHHAEWWRTVDA